MSIFKLSYLSFIVGLSEFFFWVTYFCPGSLLPWVFVAWCQLSLVGASRGYSLVVVHGLPIAVASLVAEHRLWDMQASVVVAHGLNVCDSWALERGPSTCGAWA